MIYHSWSTDLNKMKKKPMITLLKREIYRKEEKCFFKGALMCWYVFPDKWSNQQNHMTWTLSPENRMPLSSHAEAFLLRNFNNNNLWRTTVTDTRPHPYQSRAVE